MKKRLTWESILDPYEDLDDEIDELDPEAVEVSSTKKLDLFVITPAGLFRLPPNVKHDNSNSWRAFTNFNVSTDVIKIIDKIPGIESVVAQSRYSFVISIGRLFETADVMNAIHKALDIEFDTVTYKSDPIPKDLNDEVSKKIEELKGQHDHWCIYVCPNGKMDCFSSSTEGEVKIRLEIYNSAVNSVGGSVFSSCSKSPALN